MNALDDIVDVAITKTTQAVSRQGLNQIIVVTNDGVMTSDRINTYEGDLSAMQADMTADGFDSADSAWQLVAKVMAQTIKVKKVKVGAVHAADSGDYTTALDAIALVDPDFYFVVINSRAEAVLADVAAWCESHDRVLIGQTRDAAVLAGTAGNVAEDLNALSYRRTLLAYDASEQYIDAAIAGLMATANLDAPAGSRDLAFKTLVGVAPISLTPSQRSTLHGLQVNTFETRGGKRIVMRGNMIGGTPAGPIPLKETVSIDWLDIRTTENLFAWLSSAESRNFDQAGIDGAVGIVDGLWSGDAVRFGHLTTGSASAPPYTEQQINDIEAGHLPNIEAVGTIATPLRKVTVRGKVTAA